MCLLDSTLSPTFASLEKAAIPTGKKENKAPGWANGSLVYRIFTTDDPDVLRHTEQGLAMVHHLLDDSIRQIPILCGLIGDDHRGAWNWDGLWPCWDRVTFRARNWETLHGFMLRVKEESNTTPSFHVNITDVNAGLGDYPESREFFKKLVETGSIYRRDGHQFWPNVYVTPPFSPERDMDPPYVPREIPKDNVGPIEIIALVNYKKIWDSGVAKEMIDRFYSRLPYAPPILYLDVLTLNGSNFSTGFPDGPLGGSEGTQLEGVLAIANYLHEKGTDIGTEGDRPNVGERGSYGWLHCLPGYSADDYSLIMGASRYLPLQHVAGNTGSFGLSPIASTAYGLNRVRAHYEKLLAGLPGSKPTAGVDTCHIAHPVGSTPKKDIPGIVTQWHDPFSNTDIHAKTEFDTPGAGDPFRGDWADLVNNFYLTGIQELYHIGKENVRTAVFNRHEVIYLNAFVLVDSDGVETTLSAADFVSLEEAEGVRKSRRLLIGKPMETLFKAPHSGSYRLSIRGSIPANVHGSLNIYVNGGLQCSCNEVVFPSWVNDQEEFSLGEISLNAVDNTFAVDAGPLLMQWSDGTMALWATPYLNRGFHVRNGDVTFADDYDRMWPDTWSGQRKIYFFSWDGTERDWKLPQDWDAVQNAALYPLSPDGRGKGIRFSIIDRNFSPKLLPQVPYVLVPEV